MILITGLQRGCTTLTVNKISFKYKTAHIHEPFNIKHGLKDLEVLSILNGNKYDSLLHKKWKNSKSKIRIIFYRLLVLFGYKISVYKDPFIFTFFDDPIKILNRFDVVYFVYKHPDDFVNSNLKRGGAFKNSIKYIFECAYKQYCKEFLKLKNLNDEDRLYQSYILAIKRAKKYKVRFINCDENLDSNLELIGSMQRHWFYRFSIWRRGMMNSGIIYKPEYYKKSERRLSKNNETRKKAIKLYEQINNSAPFP